MRVITRNASSTEFAVFYEVDADTLQEILSNSEYYRDPELVSRAASQAGPHAVVMLLTISDDINILRDWLGYLLTIYKSVSWYDRGHNRFYTRHAPKGEHVSSAKSEAKS